MVRYHAALVKEMRLFAQNADTAAPLETIFLGGGTPSTYPDALLLDMFATLEEVFDIKSGAEVSIEVNPGTVRPEQLMLWRDVGINRISMGVQCLDDDVLKRLNRHQSADDTRRLVADVAKVFDNNSIDLIVGLPGVTGQAWKAMLREIVNWPIKHVSIYFLTLHENTRLYFEAQKNNGIQLTDEEIIDLYQWTVDFLREHGFYRYETSNFARQGYESLHNSAYWEHKPYRGFGLGACSFDGDARFKNIENLTTYMDALEHDRLIFASEEMLTQEQLHLEKIMLGLRRSRGVTVADVEEGLSQAQRDHVQKKIEQLQDAGLIRCVEGNLILTDAGFVVQNEIAVQLCE